MPMYLTDKRKLATKHASSITLFLKKFILLYVSCFRDSRIAAF